MMSISNPTLVSLNDVVDLLDTANKPVLYIDTCSLLDILRLPLPGRDNSLTDLNALLEIRNLFTSGDAVAISSEICVKEYNDHASTYIDSYPIESEKIQKPVNMFLDFINASGIAGSVIPKVDLKIYSLEVFFSDVVKSIVDKTSFVIVDQSLKQKAHNRTIDKVAPASKKGEYKDCIVWETFIRIRTQQLNKSNPAFYLSSNTADYCKMPKTWDFHPQLMSEVNGHNSFYSSGYASLKQRLKSMGIL